MSNSTIKSVAEASPEPGRSLKYLDGQWSVEADSDETLHWVGEVTNTVDSVSFEELEELAQTIGVQFRPLPGHSDGFELRGETALIDRAQRRLDRYIDRIEPDRE